MRALKPIGSATRKTNKRTSIISAIASMSQKKTWNEFVGYDEELQDDFNNAINDPTDKKNSLCYILMAAMNLPVTAFLKMS